MVKACIVVLLLGLMPHSILAKPEGFYLERLPRGKAVTLPLPATVFVSLKNRVSLQATDSAQVIKLAAVNVEAGRVEPIRLAIFDRNSDRVQYFDLRPGLPFLYNFKGLDKISLVPEIVGKSVGANIKLRIESNKPLEVSR